MAAAAKGAPVLVISAPSSESQLQHSGRRPAAPEAEVGTEWRPLDILPVKPKIATPGRPAQRPARRRCAATRAREEQVAEQ
jgi:hypothetical protein